MGRSPVVSQRGGKGHDRRMMIRNTTPSPAMIMTMAQQQQQQHTGGAAAASAVGTTPTSRTKMVLPTRKGEGHDGLQFDRN